MGVFVTGGGNVDEGKAHRPRSDEGTPSDEARSIGGEGVPPSKEPAP